MGHRHIMLKLLLSLVLLLQVGHNHAKLSASSQRQLAVYRKMLEEAEQAEVTPETNAGNDEAYYASDAGNNGTGNDAVDAKGSGDANNTLAFRTMKNGMDNGLKVENDTDASNDADPGPEPEPASASAPAPGPDPGPEPEPESARAPAPDPANYQLGKLLSGILGQLTSGNPVKMIVDIKNPEVMIDEEDGTDI